jgi:hypothetical protein
MSTPLSTQVGGDHYKSLPIQPTEFCQRNGLGHCESSVVKYVCRHRRKGGRQDLEKAIHYLQILLELEYPESKASEPKEDLEPRMPAPKLPTFDACGNIVPEELLPLPPVPEGYDRWAYRGRGYATKVRVMCATRDGLKAEWCVWSDTYFASGNGDSFYLEAIKDPC